MDAALMDAGDEPTLAANPRWVCPEQDAVCPALEAVKRRAALSSRGAIEGSKKTVVAETSQSSAEIHGSSEEEGSTIRSTAKSRKGARKKERSRRKAAAKATPSQSSAEIHRPSEEEASTMAEVDCSLHEEEEEEELSDWMSQLFEKLDLEVYGDSICSTDNVAQVGTYPIVEGGISAEISRDVGCLHEEDQSSDWISLLFDKSSLGANEDSICSTAKVPQVNKSQHKEGGISSKIHGSSEEKYSTMAKVKKGGLDDEEYIDWMIEILKKGGHNDILSCYNLDEGEKHHVHNVPDEFCDPLDKEANDYCKSTERVSKKEIIKKGIKWMSEECFLAFTTYAEKINLEGIEHKFGELRYQCLSVEAYDKIFHHYNFTIEAKHRNSGVSTSELYFAEVKQLAGDKSYFCCLLEQSDEGHCYGCKNQDMYDLKHPNTGCYEEGDADICWPFIDVTDYDSDDGDDCGGLGC